MQGVPIVEQLREKNGSRLVGNMGLERFTVLQTAELLMEQGHLSALGVLRYCYSSI